ncbi:hypothetical protein GW17_00010899 [Ensete ventricosum]|uniref:Uncharacterized protein n=1 Tax=Ensete ventricosum TaxID=4639 RepID=A0A426ZIZ7_ENSVE|nr:hypothetical protein B296_00010388 [Ensete ventricosum]RWW24804.1 hypothetical protein GW17_00010899 [Ensete ventricosum]RZS06560.1 hypothetical protein BHM03_00037239 [Ensete ventricosum]
MHVGVIHCLEQANAPFLSTFLMYPWAECDDRKTTSKKPQEMMRGGSPQYK